MNLTPETTVADVAVAVPRAIPVFQKHGIDFRCGGRRALGEVCAEKGVAFDALAGEIASSAAEPGSGDHDWTTAPFSDIVRHIIDTYHAPLRAELPRLEALLTKVAAAHAEAHGETLARIGATYRPLRAELESHMEKEEHVLFPYLVELERVSRGLRPPHTIPLGLAAGATGVMEREHESAGIALAALRRLTGGYRPPDGACGSFRALYAGLEIFESDMHRHIHLENNVLFPRAIEMEQRS